MLEFIAMLLTLLSCPWHSRNCWYLWFVVVYLHWCKGRTFYLWHFVLIVDVFTSAFSTHNYFPYKSEPYACPVLSDTSRAF
jgi:hypothetical protein